MNLLRFGRLITEDLTAEVGKRKFILIEPLTYDCPIWKGLITVPAGFVTDFASIPAIIWPILPPIGAYDKAAVVHDWFYVNNGCTRAEADGVLKQGMRDLGVNGFKLQLIWLGVRSGGWVPWGKYRGEKNVSH